VKVGPARSLHHLRFVEPSESFPPCTAVPDVLVVRNSRIRCVQLDLIQLVPFGTDRLSHWRPWMSSEGP